MTRFPSVNLVEPILATIVPSPDDEYIARLEFDNNAMGQLLQAGEQELVRLRFQYDQLRLALEQARVVGTGDSGAELPLWDRDALLGKMAAVERERDLLRQRVFDLEYEW